MENILILKRSAFGDIVHTLPLIPALRQRFPGIRITWLTGIGFEQFLRSVEGVDEVVEVGFRRGGMRSYRRATSYPPL